ncbi:U2 small nuclear ribonucleoprotein A'-like [Gorilla gorilla gorilla]|uniref:U2 small nuclear ribonucleoprotein A'-like n=1 Tax=Gorilla gorilla gorilla TaxID=9595 RepID=UPI002445A13D|nr:U2 small nuclear ribonucleoprotein A'-like [Gorilla gorilla gorilla]
MELKAKARELREECRSLRSRCDQLEERVSAMEDEMNEMKREGKFRLKRIKRNEQSLREIWDYVKRPNLRLIGVPESDGENGTKLENTLQDIIQENFPHLARQANIQIQEIQRTPQRYSSRGATPRHIIVRITKVEMKEKMLRAAREKGRVTLKGKPTRLTADLSAETLQARREWGPIFNILKRIFSFPQRGGTGGCRMGKLTAELIEQAVQYTNAVRDRELDLRGYKIPIIENLGATLDQFDAIDFSDNEIRKLDGFPLLRRLKTMLVNNNRICRIGEGLDQALPCLTELILTNNRLVELGDLDPLASLKSLTYLSILRNPVTNKKHYRLYVIYKVPQVRVLDFQKMKLKERQEAEKMFKGKRGSQLAKDIARRSKTFNPGAGLPTDKKKGGPSPGDVEAIKNAIANASTLAEVERLKGLLQSGQIPGRECRSGPTGDGEEEMEEDTVINGS